MDNFVHNFAKLFHNNWIRTISHQLIEEKITIRQYIENLDNSNSVWTENEGTQIRDRDSTLNASSLLKFFEIKYEINFMQSKMHYLRINLQIIDVYIE